MTAYNTGTGQYPTLAQQASNLCWFKSNTADATARAWTVIGDDKGFYLQMNSAATVGSTNFYGFGWFPSYKAGDAYNSFVAGATTFNNNQPSGGGGLLLSTTWVAAG